MENSTNFFEQCTFTNEILIRYLGTSIFIIGIISTFLSIYVFTRKELRRKSCCFYFLILAISDLIHLTTMIIEHLPHSFHIDLIIIHSIVCKTIIFLIYFSNHLSNLVLTLASIDRFILIYCPTRSKYFCKIRYARWFVFIVILILFISNGHILYGYEKFNVSHSPSSPIIADCNIPEEKIFYRKLFHYYDSYIESIVFVLIPFILMSISSVLIIFQIFETRRTVREKRRRRLREKDVQLCFMLIATSFAFLLLCLPAEINDLFNYHDHGRSCFQWSRKVLLMLLQQIYYAGHFYIYTLTGEIFRQPLYQMFCRRQIRESRRSSKPTANPIFGEENLPDRQEKKKNSTSSVFNGRML